MAKVRLGFVSNSSSSSFIIAVPAGMEPTEDNFHKAIFDTDEQLNYPAMYGGAYGDIPVDSKSIVKDIIKQLAESKPEDGYDVSMKIDNLDEVAEANLCMADYDKFEDSAGNIDWAACNMFIAEQNKLEADRIRSEFPNHDFYVVSYADGNGSFEAAVEHGDALKRPNIIRYSHH